MNSTLMYKESFERLVDAEEYAELMLCPHQTCEIVYNYSTKQWDVHVYAGEDNYD